MAKHARQLYRTIGLPRIHDLTKLAENEILKMCTNYMGLTWDP